MDTDIDGRSLWSRMVAQWQPVVLVTACLAAGLTLVTGWDYFSKARAYIEGGRESA